MKKTNSTFISNPDQALQCLLEGNERFVNGVRSVEPMFSYIKMSELAQNGQKPFAIVLTCSDSRSPVEMIFDQGVGQVFVVRVAGNVVAPSLLASIEFAAANFGSSLILVMGHSMCGAVNATLQHVENPSNILPSPHLEELVSRIRPAVEISVSRHKDIPRGDLVEECTVENVKRSVNLIVEQSLIVRSLIDREKIKIKGALLDIATGKVNILDFKSDRSDDKNIMPFLQSI